MVNRLHRWLRRLLPDARFERDLRDELRAHIEHRTDDLIRSGVEPAEARRRAHVEFGGAEGYAEAIRDDERVWLRHLPESLWREVRIGARRLLAAPLFTSFAVLSLALGLGVTTSVYSVLHTLLWKPIAMADPDEVVVVAAPTSMAGTLSSVALSERDFDELSKSQTTFGMLAGSSSIQDTLANVRAAEQVRGEAVRGDYFAIVGLPMLAGRGLRPADGQPDANPVVVVNRRAVSQWFGGSEDAVGESIRIGGQPYEVVGIAPDRFDGFGGDDVVWTTFWIAAGHEPTSTQARRVDPDAARRVSAFGRLASGRSIDEMDAEVRTLSDRLDMSVPARYPENRRDAGQQWPRDWRVRPLAAVLGDQGGLVTPAGVVVFALVGVVLLVACTNLANLMLARGASRDREFAIRRSLGASRARLIRELGIESGLIAVAGGVLAIGVARYLLVSFAVDVPVREGRSIQLDPELNLPVLAIAAGSLLLSLAVFGLGPAFRLTRPSGSTGPGDARGVGLMPKRGPWRLIRLQVAASVFLVLVASIGVRVLADAARHDSGIDLDQLVVASVYFNPDRGHGEVRAREIMSAALQSARAQPAISSAAASTGMPFGQTMTPLVAITTPDAPFKDGEPADFALTMMATPAIFQTLGVEITRGRAFNARDRAGAPSVVVLSEWEARAQFGSVDAVGREVLIRQLGREAVLTEVVGIAADTDVQALTTRRTGLIYLPLAQAYSPGMVLVARPAGDSDAAIAALTESIRQADPDLGVFSVVEARRVLAGGYILLRLVSGLTAGLGALALLLSMVGLYGVLSQFVAVRTREMGLRVALGATSREIRRLALTQGIRPVLSGLGVGIVSGLIVRGWVRAMVTPVSFVDWTALVAVPLLIVTAAAIACHLPARRAARVDPNVALRDL